MLARECHFTLTQRASATSQICGECEHWSVRRHSDVNVALYSILVQFPQFCCAVWSESYLVNVLHFGSRDSRVPDIDFSNPVIGQLPLCQTALSKIYVPSTSLCRSKEERHTFLPHSQVCLTLTEGNLTFRSLIFVGKISNCGIDKLLDIQLSYKRFLSHLGLLYLSSSLVLFDSCSFKILRSRSILKMDNSENLKQVKFPEFLSDYFCYQLSKGPNCLLLL